MNARVVSSGIWHPPSFLQLAVGRNNKKGRSSTSSKHAPRTAAALESGQQPVISGGASATSGSQLPSSTFPRPATGAAAASSTSAAAATAAAESTPPPPVRRVFKRPRMIRTSLSPVLSPPPPPPPPLLSVSPVYGGGRSDFSVGGSAGGSSSRGRGEEGASIATSPRLPAASDVRMGQAEVQAFVQRLRRVAAKERERRAKCTAVGGGGGVVDEPRVPLEIKTAVEELRRVVVHGDATTLDVLLSSQVGCFDVDWVGRCHERDLAQSKSLIFLLHKVAAKDFLYLCVHEVG